MDAALKTYHFRGFTLDTAERALIDATRPTQLQPKTFETLLMLVENAGRVVSKERMLAEIWEGSFVEENNLAQNISLLRKLLGETSENKFIETVPKFGYRFVAEVCVDTGVEVFEQTRARAYIDEGGVVDSGFLPETGAIADLPARSPVTRYVQSGDVNIAYQVVGDGPIDIVFVMGWISHVEYFWKHHLFASFLSQLASFSRLILFDKRGTGLSDRVPIHQLPTLEQRMEDVTAVMDAVGSDRAVLFGISEGGPMCALFAATYPERTSALVMFGTYARRIQDDDYPWAPPAGHRSRFLETIATEWGKPVGIEKRAPSMANDPEFRAYWAEYLRMGASPGAAVALAKMNAEIDVRNVLPLVHVPTLVLHRTGDKCLKVEEGRYVASKIPGSRFVEFPGDDHVPFVGNQKEILDEIEAFVTSTQTGGDHDRVLATVMSVAFADSHGERERLGDEAWAGLVTPSREFVRKRLKLFNGLEVSVTDDETLAAFNGPARAIRCAIAINEVAAREDVTLEIGLHTGECDVTDDRYSGFAVELARCVRSLSGGGNIIVSRTVKDLVAGSGLAFEEFGVHSFDGIEGEWRLFKVIA